MHVSKKKNPAKCGHEDANKSERPEIRKDVQEIDSNYMDCGHYLKIKWDFGKPNKGPHARRISFYEMEFS